VEPQKMPNNSTLSCVKPRNRADAYTVALGEVASRLALGEALERRGLTREVIRGGNVTKLIEGLRRFQRPDHMTANEIV
jgi:hypothetical protein